MKKLISTVAIMAFLSIALVSLAADPLPPIPPLPKDFEGIKIIKPDPSLPKEIADFIGEWEGVWNVSSRPGSPSGDLPMEVRRAKMIVYEVSANQVKYLWGTGTNPTTHAEGQWTKYESGIEERGGRKRFSHQGPYGYAKETRKTEFYVENDVLCGTIGYASIDMKRVK